MFGEWARGPLKGSPLPRSRCPRFVSLKMRRTPPASLANRTADGSSIPTPGGRNRQCAFRRIVQTAVRVARLVDDEEGRHRIRERGSLDADSCSTVLVRAPRNGARPRAAAEDGPGHWVPAYTARMEGRGARAASQSPRARARQPRSTDPGARRLSARASVAPSSGTPPASDLRLRRVLSTGYRSLRCR